MDDPLLDSQVYSSTKKEKKYIPKPPKQLPTTLSIACGIIGLLVIVLVVIIAFIYFLVIKQDKGVDGSTVIWIVFLVLAFLIGAAFMTLAFYCLFCRAKFWFTLKEKRRAKSQSKELEGLRVRKEQRREEHQDLYDRYESIREKYGLKKDNLSLEETL